MIDEKMIPLLTENEEGNTIPWTGLTQNNFKFKRTDTSERIYFTGFTDQGSGCYVFSGFKKMVDNVLVDLTDIQPVWLYINDTAYYKKGAFYVGNPELHFVSNVAFQNLVDAVADKISKTQVDITTAKKTFSGGIQTALIEAITELNISGKIYLGSNASGTPMSNFSEKYANSLTRRSYVQSEIEAKIQSVLAGNYVESANIIRLMPNGSQVIGQIYLTWSTALGYASSFTTSSKFLTILLCGAGTSSGYLDMATYEISTGVFAYVKDYTHIKGLGTGFKVKADGNFAETYSQFQAGALGRIVIEDVDFYFDNDGQSGEIKKILFKNCSFKSNGGIINFVDCGFEGTNNFDSTTDNEFSFTNCIGSPIFTTKEITVGGTNLITYEMKNKKVTPQVLLEQVVFSDTVRGAVAENKSLFLDTDNSDKLSFKDGSGNVHEISMTLLT